MSRSVLLRLSEQTPTRRFSREVERRSPPCGTFAFSGVSDVSVWVRMKSRTPGNVTESRELEPGRDQMSCSRIGTPCFDTVCIPTCGSGNVLFIRLHPVLRGANAWERGPDRGESCYGGEPRSGISDGAPGPGKRCLLNRSCRFSSFLSAER